MTENFMLLLAVLAVIILGCAVVLSKKGRQSSDQSSKRANPSSRKSAAMPRPAGKKQPNKKVQSAGENHSGTKTELDRLIDILQASSSLEDHVYRNRYVPTASGQIECIQAMYLGPRGMMIFHLISDEGWILGDQDSRWWTFCVSSDERNYIDNPVWRCQDLIESLKNFLPETEDIDYHIGVVFSDRCEIRAVEVRENVYIGNLSQLTDDFQELLSRSKPVYDVGMVEKLAMIFDVMDDPDTVIERLTTLIQDMKDTQEAMARQKAEIQEAEAKKNQKEKRELLKKPVQRSNDPEERFTHSEVLLRDSLVIWRKQQADIEDVSVIEIFDNLTLDLIVNFKPLSLDSLKKIPGFDDRKLDRYGKSIVAMVQHAPV